MAIPFTIIVNILSRSNSNDIVFNTLMERENS